MQHTWEAKIENGTSLSKLISHYSTFLDTDGLNSNLKVNIC